MSSIESNIFAPASPLSSQQNGTASSSFSPVNCALHKAGEPELSKFDSYINGKASQCESLNTSGELSTNPASRSSCGSPPNVKRDITAADAEENNLLMIDQKELLELMQAKLTFS